MIAGLVVAGFDLAPVYIAPLATYLLATVGVHKAMAVFGVAFFVVVSLLATFLVNPPPGYVPVNLNPDEDQPETMAKVHSDTGTAQVLRSPQFWKLCVVLHRLLRGPYGDRQCDHHGQGEHG